MIRQLVMTERNEGAQQSSWVTKGGGHERNGAVLIFYLLLIKVTLHITCLLLLCRFTRRTGRAVDEGHLEVWGGEVAQVTEREEGEEKESFLFAPYFLT